MQLFDWENIIEDELVGSTQFLFKDIQNGVYKQPFWVNIYGISIKLPSGSQVGLSKEDRKEICSNPELGSRFSGKRFSLIGRKDFTRDFLRR